MDVKFIITGVVAAVAVIPVAIMLGNKAPLTGDPSANVVSEAPADSPTSDAPSLENPAIDTVEQEAAPAVIAETEVQDATTPAEDGAGQAPVALMDTFELVAPGESTNCATRDPWGQGIKTLGDQDELTNTDCFALRVTVLEDVEVYLFSHSENGKLIRLFPNECNALGPVNSHVYSGEEIQLPQDSAGNHMVIGLDENTGKEWFYAVAMKSDQQRDELNSITGEVPDVCQEGATFQVPVTDFQASLDKLQQQSGGAFQWLSRSFLHI
ncbi:MAG: DUF4384 domain-containing protein [Gammaproteobacteria bacterium]|jgi:hypothetical protein